MGISSEQTAHQKRYKGDKRTYAEMFSFKCNQRVANKNNDDRTNTQKRHRVTDEENNHLKTRTRDNQ